MTAACCIIAMNLNDNVDVTMHRNLAMAYDYAVEKIGDLYPDKNIFCFDDVRELVEDENIVLEIRDINLKTLEVIEL